MSRTSLALAALVVLGAGALSGCAGQDDAAPADASATHAVEGDVPADDPEEPTVDAAPTIAVGDSPVGVATGADGAVWVTSFGPSELARIPAGARQPDLTVPVGSTPLRVATAYDAVWVTAFGSGRLDRVDPGSGEVTDEIAIGAGAEGVTAGFGSVWVVAQDAGQLVRVDPEARKVVDRIRIGVGARLVTAGSDAMWVGHFGDDKVLRVDPRSGKVTASKRIGSGPQDLVALPDVVWVTCTFSDEVVGLDPRTLELVTRVEVAGSPDPIVTSDDGRVFVVAEEGPTVHELDPATGEVLATVVLGEAPALYDRANIDATVAGGEIWVSSLTDDAVYHAPLP